MKEWAPQGGEAGGQVEAGAASTPGKRTLCDGIPAAAFVQQVAGATPPSDSSGSPAAGPISAASLADVSDPPDWPGTVHAAAADGVASSTAPLPHHDRLAASFGPSHGLDGVRAHVGGEGEASARAMGAEAYATGQDVVLPANPSLHLVAHEVAHVAQQRQGVQLAGGVGAAGDPYEREADDVADAVVRGEPVGHRFAPGGAASGGVQRKEPAGPAPSAALPPWVEPQLRGLLLIPVAEGDMAMAKVRVDGILALVHALHRDVRKLLLARLEHDGDELATLFHHQLSTTSRKHVFAVLRDETPAATEEPSPTPTPADARGDADATAAHDGKAPAAGDAWRHVVGEHSVEVNKMARVRAPLGVRLRSRPAPGASNDSILPFDELVQVQRRTDHGWCWVVSMGGQVGKTGFCEEQFLSLDPPEPTAHLHAVKDGETLGAIANAAYGKSMDDENNVRLYVQALYLANKGHAGVYLDEVSLDWDQTLLRSGSEEETVKIYKGAKVRKGLAIWVPSDGFIQQLKAQGLVSSGSTEVMKAWHKAEKFVDGVIDTVKYAAGFIVGLLEGAFQAIVDLFKGAADMIETVVKVLYDLITGNPGAVKDMLMGWVEKLKVAWQHRDKIADWFMSKWEAKDGWDRGLFQGEVLGWVMMTALIMIVTMGEGAAAEAGGTWAAVLDTLRTVNALGDVTTYVGKGLRLPGEVASFVSGKLGRGAKTVERVADDGARVAGTVAKDAGEVANDAGKAEHAADDAARAVDRGTSDGARAGEGKAGEVPSEPGHGAEPGAKDPSVSEEAIRQVFRKADKVKKVEAVSLKRLRNVLGRAGSKPGRYMLRKATAKELEALGSEADNIFGWVVRDGAGTLMRDAGGRPVITFTRRGGRRETVGRRSGVDEMTMRHWSST